MSEPIEGATNAAPPAQTNENDTSLNLSGIESFLAENDLKGNQEEPSLDTTEEVKTEESVEPKDELGDLFKKFEEENKKKVESDEPEETPDAPMDIGKLPKFLFEGKEYTPKDVKDGFLRQADYTQKTMALANERKSFDQNKSQLENERVQFKETLTKNTERLNQLEELDYFIDHIAQANPDLFDSIKTELSGFRTHYANPIITNLKKELAEIKSTFQKNDESREAVKLKADYDRELSLIQKDLIPELETLGLKINMDEVNKLWVDGADLGLSLKQAINAKYGDDIRRLYQSKAKITKAEKEVKNSAKVVSSSSTRSVPAKQKVDIKGMGWNDLANYLNGIDLAS